MAIQSATKKTMNEYLNNIYSNFAVAKSLSYS